MGSPVNETLLLWLSCGGKDQAPRVPSSKELLGILEAQLKTRDWTDSKVLFNVETWKVKTEAWTQQAGALK